MTVVVLQHVAVEGPGRIADALDRAHRRWRTVHLHGHQPVPIGPSDIDGLVVMGGPMSVGDTDRFPHLGAEKDLIADCLAADIPVLGVCLGAQLLAATLGADVAPGPSLELGWLPVTLTPDAANDALLARPPRTFDALHWHGDVMALPTGAVHLASSEQTAVQAFRYGATAYGLLCHLEADVAQVAAMAHAFPHDVQDAGVDVDDLLDHRRADALAPVAEQVFDAWVDLLP